MSVSARTWRVARFGVYELDSHSGELSKRGLRLKVHGQPLEVLALLLDRPGELLTREELREKLWPSDTFVDFDTGLNKAINRLREVLGDSADNPRFIETLPRRGYRFIASVEGGGAPTSPSAANPAAVTGLSHEGRSAPPAPAPPPRSHQRVLRLGLAAAVLLAGLLVLDVGGVRERLTARAAPHTPIRSLAVLPLQNLSGDSSQDYFADGMTDALITDLAQISALRVISRTSAMRYKETKKTLPEVARELNVDAVVEGSVVRSGGRVRITAQLVHAPTDRHLWAQSYERGLSDVLELQGEVARTIAGQIAVQLTPQERQRLARARPVHPQAYEAYLRGRHLWNQRSPESLRKSIEYYEQALQADPSYALAYAGLADSYGILGFGGVRTMPHRLAATKGHEAALRAVALDDSLAEAHAALGRLKSLTWDDAGAEAEFRRALQLNPGYAVAYHWQALHLQQKGNLPGYCSNIRRSYELDPLNPNVSRHVAYCLYSEGQPEKAVELLKKVLELYPSQSTVRATLADIHSMRGDLKAAIPEYERAVELSGNHPNFRLWLAWAYLASGKRDDALKIWRDVEKRPDASEYAYTFGVLNLEAGRKEEALRWLERAVQQHTIGGIHFDTRLKPLRSDSRFQELLQRLKNPAPARP